MCSNFNQSSRYSSESDDLFFYDFSKIANAFGYKYFCTSTNFEIKCVIDEILKLDNPLFCKIFTDKKQNCEPNSSAKRTLVSPLLEDLAPFLPRKKLERNMFIPLIGV